MSLDDLLAVTHDEVLPGFGLLSASLRRF